MKQTINLLDLIEQIHIEKKDIVWHEYPFKTRKDSTIEDFYKNLCEEIKRSTQTSYQVEVDNYGSGYASYYDAWFYQESADFDMKMLSESVVDCEGLVVLFHRMLPYYVLMQGSKSWTVNYSTGSTSYLPSRKMLDNFTNDAVKNLAQKVEKFLA